MKIFLLILILLINLRSFSQSFVPDTSINQIALVDANSVLNILGKDSWDYLIEENEEPEIIVYNRDKSEKLELIFHEGGNRNNFSEFRISKVLKGEKSTKHKYLVLNEDHFKSSNDIKLGISQKSLELKLGFKPAKKVSKNGEVTIFFRREIDKDPIFAKYNMPIYYGEYVFMDDSLLKFSFGFEKP